MKRDINDFFIACRCNAVDKKLAQDMAESIGVSESDLVKMALWSYATSSESKLIKASLKELAYQQKKSFEIKVFKELEAINNRQAFFIDGVKTALENYRNKHVPLRYVKQFIIIKIIGLYTIYPDSKTRKEYLDYLNKNFQYHFPSQAIWMSNQLKSIKSMKKDEKDKLLLNIRRQALSEPDMAIDGIEHMGQDGRVDENIKLKVDVKDMERKIDDRNEQQKLKLKFYRDKKGI